jgi:deazaflavin-dependent oxidoreductase (nitroreductase family)
VRERKNFYLTPAPADSGSAAPRSRDFQEMALKREESRQSRHPSGMLRERRLEHDDMESELPMKQAMLNRIRAINKYATNKLMIHISGKKFGHFAILSHVGRKSGKIYRIPIIAEPIKNGFVIALTYGKKVDWYENVMAKGSCSIHWKNKEYSLINPELIDKEIGLMAFPAIFRSGLRKMGIQYYLRLEIKQEV